MPHWLKVFLVIGAVLEGMRVTAAICSASVALQRIADKIEEE